MKKNHSFKGKKENSINKKHSFKDTFADTRLMLGYIWEGDKSLVFFKLLAILINSVEAVINTLYIKWIIDFITLRESFKKIILFIITIEMVSLLLRAVSNAVSGIVIPEKEFKMRNYLQNLFMKRAMNQDLECYEDFHFYDNYTKAIRIADTKAIDFLNLIFTFAERVLSAILMASIIFTLDPFMLIIAALIIIISFIDQSKSIRYSHDQYEAGETINRRSEYVKKVSHFRGFAKEVRIYRLGDFLIDKLNEMFVEKYKIYKNANIKYWRFKYFITVLRGLCISPALLIYIAFRAVNGSITLGSFAVLYSSCFSVSGEMSGVITSIDRLNFESEFYVTHLRGILDYKPVIEADITGKKDIDKIESIAFVNVSFHYPGHENLILKDVSFYIEPCEKVALVGRNGAGKSTIIKLILRLYDVSDGEILINGVNIKEYNIVMLRKCFSAVMQDFNIFSFSVRDNITLGEFFEDDMIMEALNFSGMSDKINGLDGGVDAAIGREFDEKGVNFSGGELQKLALSRAYIRRSSVMILDEANSSLDPVAEYELNEKMMRMASEQIALFVSHRLTTTALADKIIMIDDGRIIEEGTHEQLYANAEGQYHQMYEKQARAYKVNQEAEEYE